MTRFIVLASLCFLLAAGFSVHRDGREKRVPQVSFRIVRNSDNTAARSKRRAMVESHMYWSSRVVPYELAGHYSGAEGDKIRKAMKEWEEKTCVTFRPRQPGEDNYVMIQSTADGICEADQGMIGGKQAIHLSPKGCLSKSTIQHEIGHMLGLSHEHQHPNRDKYITVVTENIKPESLEWMQKLKASDHNYFGLDFDMDSVMTYDSWSNAIGKERTMVTKDPSLQHRLDNYDKFLSYSDVAYVNKMEKCGELCDKDVACPEDSYLDQYCKCITPQYYFDTYCEDKKTADWCFNAAVAGKCLETDVTDNCAKTCDLCPMYHVQRKQWTGGCENKYYMEEKCTEWAAAGKCKVQNQLNKFMVKWCAKACGQCDVNLDCLDTEDCSGYEAKYCKSDSEHNGYMMDNCKNWCGLGPKTCSKTGSEGSENVTPVETAVACKDTVYCGAYEKAYCETNSEYYGFMMDSCRNWCGLGPKNCPETGNESNESVTTVELAVACRDKVYCAYERAYCEPSSEYYEFMMENCRRSCGVC